jgi:hypothetical protein
VKSEVSTLRARDTHMVFDRSKQMENPRSLVYEKLRETRTVQVMNFDINGNCSCLHHMRTVRDRDLIASRAPVWIVVLKSQSVDLRKPSYTQDELKFHFEWPKQESNSNLVI